MSLTVHNTGLAIAAFSDSLTSEKVSWTCSNGGAGVLQVMTNHAPDIHSGNENWADISPAQTVGAGETLTFESGGIPCRLRMTAAGDVHGVKLAH